MFTEPREPRFPYKPNLSKQGWVIIALSIALLVTLGYLDEANNNASTSAASTDIIGQTDGVSLDSPEAQHLTGLLGLSDEDALAVLDANSPYWQCKIDLFSHWRILYERYEPLLAAGPPDSYEEGTSQGLLVQAELGIEMNDYYFLMGIYPDFSDDLHRYGRDQAGELLATEIFQRCAQISAMYMPSYVYTGEE